MSYILDALNKSEQERKRARTPGLDTMHRSGARTASPVRLALAGLLLLAVINGGFLAYWFGAHHSSPARPAPPVTGRGAQPAPQVPAPATTVNTENPPPGSVTAPQEPAGQLVTPNSSVATGGANTAPAPASGQTMNISDLPEAVQRQIPAMTFSSHIYSDDAKYRMVSINGKLLHEGDMVSPGIRLVHITEEGVVLTFEGYTFEVSVLHDWSFN